MARIAQSIAELIGETPLLRLERLAAGSNVELLAKLELLGPGRSDKDRVARTILDKAEVSGKLQPGGIIVEPTSGNIAFSLAMLAVPRGYRLVLIMPDVVPAWRIRLLRAMGAEVILTPASQGMRGARERAKQIASEQEGAFCPDQFSNPANPAAHEQTAEEIWRDCDGELAAVVASVGTGGMITGVGRRLKALSEGQVQILAVEPAASPVLQGGPAAPHRLFGMGASFVPDNYDPAVVDRVLHVSDNECHDMLLRLYRTEGVLSGPSGGAAVAAALQLAAAGEFGGQRIVAIIPDGMERYAETKFWQSFRVVVPTIAGE